jgi:2-polyprenyl-3-methyl-5-hydroxy-6-metoxy-1,4-benzoquinol methylase
MVRKAEVLHAFRPAGPLTKAYLRIKFKICPVLDVEPYVPRRGRIVDLGCGNGLFAAILTLGSAERRIIGYDLDPKKIRVADDLKAANAWSNIDFRPGNITAMDYPRADVFTLIDVLYLLPFSDQNAILRRCARMLLPGGMLLIKEMDTRPRWKYAWNMVQETLAVKVIGFTLGSRFFFRSCPDFLTILSSLGFETTVIGLGSGYWYPHILYLCRKT